MHSYILVRGLELHLDIEDTLHDFILALVLRKYNWLSLFFQYLLTTLVSFLLDIIILAIYEPIGRAAYERKIFRKLERKKQFQWLLVIFCRYQCGHNFSQYLPVRLGVSLSLFIKDHECSANTYSCYSWTYFYTLSFLLKNKTFLLRHGILI